jgi:hypothetical protein
MESALGSSRALAWPEPKELPVWKPFTRGQYAIRIAPPQPAPLLAPRSTAKSTETSTTTSTPTGHGAFLTPEDEHSVPVEHQPPGRVSP